jgi:hypothetical protein
MSVQIHINVSNTDESTARDRGMLYCDTRLTLSKWVEWDVEIAANQLRLWHKFPVIARPIDLPVRFLVVDKIETMVPKNCDHTTMFFSRTNEWKTEGLVLYKPGWNSSSILRAKSVMAYLRELPDDWPLLLLLI